MNLLEPLQKPSKLDQKIAHESYTALASAIQHLNTNQAEIEIEETNEKITIPINTALTISLEYFILKILFTTFYSFLRSI